MPSGKPLSHTYRHRDRRPPRLHTWREILDSIFYIVRSGCAWCLLPRDLPLWKTIYHYFRLWRLDGTWERINAAVREALRVKLGREAQPRAGIIDSQSVKTTGVGGERGYDGGKSALHHLRRILMRCRDRKAVRAFPRSCPSTPCRTNTSQGPSGSYATALVREMRYSKMCPPACSGVRGGLVFRRDFLSSTEATYNAA